MYLYNDAVIDIRAAIEATKCMIPDEILFSSVNIMKNSLESVIKFKSYGIVSVHISKQMTELQLKPKVDKFRTELMKIATI